MLELYFGPNEMGRPYIGPPDVPKDRLQAIRRAFDATMKDPAYLAEAKSQKMYVEPMTGEEMETLIKSFYASAPELVERLKAAIEPVSREELIGHERAQERCSAATSVRVGDLRSLCRSTAATARGPTSPTSTAARTCASWSATGPAPAMTSMPACSDATSRNTSPGQPTVVIQNMPGAASLTMTNYMYNVAPRDGTAIGLPARGLFIEPLFGNDNAKFEARKFTWIGSMSRDVATCFTWHTSGIATIEDAMKREVLVGSSGVERLELPVPDDRQCADRNEIQAAARLCGQRRRRPRDGARRARRLLQLHLGQHQVGAAAMDREEADQHPAAAHDQQASGACRMFRW